MACLQGLLLVVGAASPGTGYRRNQRKLMVAAAIVLLLAGSVDQLVIGFLAGMHDGFVASATN
ncbi:MAG: hypothetical protein EPN56_06060 [Rhodanobacter sp.]|nr:MAG: hypothetical protein EPN78_00755 [Rhodanobacter sp.]TAM10997.1 MAG: hypothetical protein EPN66_09115 [Rhodanobacter sp.]TAM36525.1 MAG: hypothetical protein EPN56_06060 [Rhodanobacter sp.]